MNVAVDMAAHECELCGVSLTGRPRKQRFCSKAHRDLGMTSPLWDRFLRHFEAYDALACWRWRGATLKGGYGRFSVPGQKTLLAHRVAYEACIGPIPIGLHLDHLCRVRNCVNPCHLEPVTQKENTLRGDTFPAANLRKTECPFGHPLDGRSRRQRFCRTCCRQKDRLRRARARQ